MLLSPQYLENVITNWRIKREWAREEGKMRGQMRHQWPWVTCKQQYKRSTFVTFANANSNRFQYGIIYSIFSCLVPGNSEFLAVPQISEFGETAKFFFVPPAKLWTRFTPLTQRYRFYTGLLLSRPAWSIDKSLTVTYYWLFVNDWGPLSFQRNVGLGPAVLQTQTKWWIQMGDDRGDSYPYSYYPRNVTDETWGV